MNAEYRRRPVNVPCTTPTTAIATDQRSGLSYYTVRITLPGDEVAKLGEVRLVPGMPVEAFVQTGERTVISYLVKPLYDPLARAFREK